MTRQEEKQQLRKTMRALLKTISPRYLERAGCSIAGHLLSMPEYQAADAVFCFVGRQPDEIDTLPILRDALAAGKRLCVPLCVDKGIMELREITSLDQLHPGSYGLLEPPADAPRLAPDEVDFSILPCLTCNRAGQRLGKGGGYYDRFLSHYRSGSVLLCPELLLRDEIPVEPHDYPIPWVLTEKGLYEDGIPARLG